LFAIVGKDIMKSFPATLENLYQMIQYVKDDALAKGFDKTEFEHIEVAIEEALVNVIHHGYKNYQGIIDISCFSNPSQFYIVIEDNGMHHDPLSFKRVIDPKEPIETRQPGGYGVHFISELMDEVIYERKGNKNCLTLVKSKKNSSPPS